MSLQISIVIITKNEAERLKGCLDSVFGWADEIILVDDESIDQTRKIAADYTDKIFVRRMDIEGKHSNWAYAQAKNEWVLSLDADERLTPELKKEIEELFILAIEAPAFAIPRKNFLGN